MKYMHVLAMGEHQIKRCDSGHRIIYAEVGVLCRRKHFFILWNGADSLSKALYLGWTTRQEIGCTPTFFSKHFSMT